jgi:hypothetical protein
LAPHIDLQLQLPAHQQLQLLCECSAVFKQKLQQQQQDGLPSSSNEPEQQQAADAEHVAAGTMPFAVAALPEQLQRMLLQLLPTHWLRASDMCNAAHVLASGGSSSNVHGALLQMLSQLKVLEQVSADSDDEEVQLSAVAAANGLAVDAAAAAAAPAAGTRGGLKQLFSSWEIEAASSKITAATRKVGDSSSNSSSSSSSALDGRSNEALEATVKSNGVTSSEHDAPAVVVSSDEEEDTSSSSSSDAPAAPGTPKRGPVSSSSSEAESPPQPPNKQQLEKTYMLYRFLSCSAMQLGVSLVLRFVEQEWDAGHAAALPAWQQALPLQVLLLCAQLQQLQGMLQQHLIGHQSADSSSSNADAISAEMDAQPLHMLLQQTISIMQSIKQFEAANEVLNNSPPPAAPDTSCSSSSSSSSSSGEVQPLHPAAFFSSSGPLAGGVWGFQQPAGAGIWAPTDAAAAAAAAAEPQHQHQQLESEACGSRSSSQMQQQQQQQVWQALLGSCAWKEACTRVDLSTLGSCLVAISACA